ncbi:MAG: Fic family protein [Pseudomonadota bacterium]
MYKGIENLPTGNELSSAELRALVEVWKERYDSLKGTETYQGFVMRLQREWAIETGIIERLYTWDRGVTEILLEQGIDATLIAHKGGLKREDAEHAKRLIDDHLGIVKGIFPFVTGDQELSEHFIRQLQAEFIANQGSIPAMTPEGKMLQVEILRGQYKKLPNNPRRPNGQMHLYCPPELVQDEMERLLRWYRELEATTSPEVLAAWLHHRFTHIHPFQDGNGRVARTLASLVFLKNALFPLIIRDKDRQRYIGALEQADRGDLAPLVMLFADRLRDAILAALSLQRQAKQARHPDRIIMATIEVLKDRSVAQVDKIGRVYETADHLQKVALERLEELGTLLNEQLASVTPIGEEKYQTRVAYAGSKAQDSHFFWGRIVEVAKLLDYFANLDLYRSWTRISIVTEKRFELVISFHGFGPGETGVMAVSAFTAQRVSREDGGTEAIDTKPASFELFQFNYAESRESVESRFRDWLEQAIIIGLEEWRRQLGV